MKIHDLFAMVWLRNETKLLLRNHGTFLSLSINNLSILQSKDGDYRKVDRLAGVGVVQKTNH